MTEHTANWPAPTELYNAPDDIRGEMPDPSVPLCAACIDAYRNGIEPGETACECRARGELEDSNPNGAT